MKQIYFFSRLSLAIIFLYHGLVPKILYGALQEIEMNSIFMPWLERDVALISTGIIEIVFAALLFVFYRSRIPIVCIIGFACLASLALLIKLPHYYVEAFNPFSINFSLVMFGLINLVSRSGKEPMEVD